MKINKNLQNLVYLYILIKPDVTPEALFLTWNHNSVFREYNRPTLALLELWYEAIFKELEELGIRRVN